MDRNIALKRINSSAPDVALRKESVDRNITGDDLCGIIVVALRKESVDRNHIVCVYLVADKGRSPQGERG